MRVFTDKIQRLVALIVCVCFMASLFPEAYAAIPSLQMAVKSETPRILNIDIPTELASVDEWYQAPATPKPKLIVHIQDAHSNYEAQTHIRDVIKYLNTNYGFKTILVEGAASELDPGILKLFPDQERNLKLVDELAKIGEVTGAEMFLVENSEAMKALGIEKPELYRKNFDALQKVYSEDAFVSGFFEAYEKKLGQIASRSFGPRLIQALGEWRKFENGHRDFLPFVSKLAELSKKVLNLDLGVLYSQIEWPQLTRLLVLQRLEKELEQTNGEESVKQRAASEKQKIIELLKAARSSEGLIRGLERFDEKTANLNRIGAAEVRHESAPRALIEALVEEGGKIGFDIRAYPAFAKYAGYLILRSEIVPGALFEEIKKLFDRILETLVKEPPSSAKQSEGDEAARKRLLLLHRDEMLASKLLKLELSHAEWLAILSRQERFYPDDLNRRMLEQLGENTRSSDGDPKKEDRMKKLNESFRAAFTFYSAAINRETYFFQRIQETLAKTDKAILITGGFHAEGMKDLMRKYDINYGTLTPRITKEFSNEQYRKVMMTGLEEAGTNDQRLQTADLRQAKSPRGLPQASPEVAQRGAMDSKNSKLKKQKSIKANYLGAVDSTEARAEFRNIMQGQFRSEIRAKMIGAEAKKLGGIEDRSETRNNAQPSEGAAKKLTVTLDKQTLNELPEELLKYVTAKEGSIVAMNELATAIAFYELGRDLDGNLISESPEPTESQYHKSKVLNRLFGYENIFSSDRTNETREAVLQAATRIINESTVFTSTSLISGKKQVVIVPPNGIVNDQLLGMAAAGAIIFNPIHMGRYGTNLFRVTEVHEDAHLNFDAERKYEGAEGLHVSEFFAQFIGLAYREIKTNADSLAEEGGYSRAAQKIGLDVLKRISLEAYQVMYGELDPAQRKNLVFMLGVYSRYFVKMIQEDGKNFDQAAYEMMQTLLSDTNIQDAATRARSLLDPKEIEEIEMEISLAMTIEIVEKWREYEAIIRQKKTHDIKVNEGVVRLLPEGDPALALFDSGELQQTASEEDALRLKVMNQLIQFGLDSTVANQAVASMDTERLKELSIQFEKQGGKLQIFKSFTAFPNITLPSVSQFSTISFGFSLAKPSWIVRLLFWLSRFSLLKKLGFERIAGMLLIRSTGLTIKKIPGNRAETRLEKNANVKPEKRSEGRLPQVAMQAIRFAEIAANDFTGWVSGRQNQTSAARAVIGGIAVGVAVAVIFAGLYFFFPGVLTAFLAAAAWAGTGFGLLNGFEAIDYFFKESRGEWLPAAAIIISQVLPGKIKDVAKPVPMIKPAVKPVTPATFKGLKSLPAATTSKGALDTAQLILSLIDLADDADKVNLLLEKIAGLLGQTNIRISDEGGLATKLKYAVPRLKIKLLSFKVKEVRSQAQRSNAGQRVSIAQIIESLDPNIIKTLSQTSFGDMNGGINLPGKLSPEEIVAIIAWGIVSKDSRNIAEIFAHILPAAISRAVQTPKQASDLTDMFRTFFPEMVSDAPGHLIQVLNASEWTLETAQMFKLFLVINPQLQIHLIIADESQKKTELHREIFEGMKFSVRSLSLSPNKEKRMKEMKSEVSEVQRTLRVSAVETLLVVSSTFEEGFSKDADTLSKVVSIDPKNFSARDRAASLKVTTDYAKNLDAEPQGTIVVKPNVRKITKSTLELFVEGLWSEFLKMQEIMQSA